MTSAEGLNGQVQDTIRRIRTENRRLQRMTFRLLVASVVYLMFVVVLLLVALAQRVG